MLIEFRLKLSEKAFSISDSTLDRLSANSFCMAVNSVRTRLRNLDLYS
jgi:hypothetical protein